ncbi:hypothetical protein BD560DRAFT_425177 [Blakeslea trispora]|nr:hypothetical protein BD560DRAFT_425177 [Blakeslea trispora]
MSCYWALLSLETFNYIYVPSNIRNIWVTSDTSVGDILFSQSLFDHIHPEELYLATIDLANFVRKKTLAGAVTRCRFLDIQSIIRQQKQIQEVSMIPESTLFRFCSENKAWITSYIDPCVIIKNSSGSHGTTDWAVTDLVMYTATDKVVLTFFHTLSIDNHNSNCCGSPELNSSEISFIKSVLKQYHIAPTLHSMWLFQIYDTHKQDPLIACHSTDLQNQIESSSMNHIHSMINKTTTHEIKRRRRDEDTPNQTTCTQPIHSKATHFIPPFDSCQVEFIVIVYGSLTFSLFQIISHYPSERLDNHSSYPNRSISSQLDKTGVKNKEISSSISTPMLSQRNKPTLPHHSCMSSKTQQEPTPSSLPRIWQSKFGIHEKRCKNCDTSTSPEWRRGPNGHKTLCNACGLRYARLMAKHEKKPRHELHDMDGKFRAFQSKE